MCKNFREKLEKLNGGPIEDSNWTIEAEWRIKNRDWIRYSQKIALRILSNLKEEMTKEKLSELSGISLEEINLIVKGSVNMNLETIAKLSKALNVDLITFPPYEYQNIS